MVGMTFLLDSSGYVSDLNVVSIVLGLKKHISLVSSMLYHQCMLKYCNFKENSKRILLM